MDGWWCPEREEKKERPSLSKRGRKRYIFLSKSPCLVFPPCPKFGRELSQPDEEKNRMPFSTSITAVIFSFPGEASVRLYVLTVVRRRREEEKRQRIIFHRVCILKTLSTLTGKRGRAR